MRFSAVETRMDGATHIPDTQCRRAALIERSSYLGNDGHRMAHLSITIIKFFFPHPNEFCVLICLSDGQKNDVQSYI
jgi:hypothetical protein